MTLPELEHLLQNRSEYENLEFKEAKTLFSILGNDKTKGEKNKKSVLGYCVGIGNMGGGKLILGVTNSGKIVGTPSAQNIGEVKKQLFENLGKRVDIEVIHSEKGRVVIFNIPNHDIGRPFKFYGIPLMRIDDDLREMDDATHRSILLEQDSDFSAQICPQLTFEDLDPRALQKIKELWSTKSRNSEILNYSDDKILTELGLKTRQGFNYACLLLLGNKNAFANYCPQAEIIYEYRQNIHDIESADRFDLRQSFILGIDELWFRISSKNITHHIQHGLFIEDIPAFDKETIRESLFNAFSHRDYRDNRSIFIRQYSDRIVIQNPGGFISGNSFEDPLKITSSWRNRRLAEVFQAIGYVERSGQGMDKIFRNTITQGKGMPDYSKSNSEEVVLSLSGVIQDLNFLEFLKKIENLHQREIINVENLYILERIRTQNTKNFPVSQETIKPLIDLGVVERIGRGRGTRYVLSHKYYVSVGQSGVYTRIIGIDREAKKTLIIQHIGKKGRGVLAEFHQAFPEISPQDVSNLLQELKRSGKIRKEGGGSGKGSYWVLNSN